MYARESSLLPDPEDEEEEAEPVNSFSQFLRKTVTAVEEPQGNDMASFLPKPPRNILDVGLSKAFLTDLTLKIIHYSGTPAFTQLTRRLGLSPNIVQQLVTALAEDRLVEVMSHSDLYTGNHRYRLSERGMSRVAQALERSRYAGPAPVTADQYGDAMRRYHTYRQELSRSRVKSSFGDMVLAPEVADSAARALFSGKAALFYGPSGNGKTTILERFARDLDGAALVPYTVYAYGQTIRVFDQSIHEPVEDLSELNLSKEDARLDRRWVLVRRPAVILGAEIGREALDLAYDPHARFYQAPPHIKAQGGVVIVDDFGRQKIDGRELLTRLLIPLERGWDTLTLVTGEKLSVPINMQVLFATNLPIRGLADDALLRRILYKVEVPNPDAQQFGEILRQLCRARKVLVADGAIDYVVKRLYGEPRLSPRASYARDLLDMVIESAVFDGRSPALDKETFDRVFKLFLVHEAEDEAAQP
jgi:hypothetical protein